MSQNFQNIPKPTNRKRKQPTGLLSSGNLVGCRDIKTKSFVGFACFVEIRKTNFIVLLLIVLSLFVSSCKTKEVPGRRRAPRHCNSCTKWSYTPQETLEYELLHNNES